MWLLYFSSSNVISVPALRALGWSCCLMLSVTAWACIAFVKCIIDYSAQQDSRSPVTSMVMKVYCLHVMLDNLLHVILNALFFLHVLSFPLSACVQWVILFCLPVIACYCICIKFSIIHSALIEHLVVSVCPEKSLFTVFTVNLAGFLAEVLTKVISLIKVSAS